MSVVFERFDSPAAFVAACSDRPVNSVFAGRSRSSREHGGADWSGADSWKEAVTIAEAGYIEVVDRVRVSASRATSAAFDRVEARPARPVNGYVGGSPNVVRAMQGLPRDMRRTVREPRKLQGVTLVYERGVLAGVSADRMIEAGARMVALVRLFERAQIPVRLIVTMASTAGSETAVCEVVVKDYATPVNLAKIAYYVAHPSAHRRLKFSWLESTSVITSRRFSQGYGASVSADRSMCETLRKHYESEGARWLCINDLKRDEDVVRVWEAMA